MYISRDVNLLPRLIFVDSFWAYYLWCSSFATATHLSLEQHFYYNT